MMLSMPEWVLISAVRYALGRHTYVVHDTTELVRFNWPEITTVTKRIILRDIMEHLVVEERHGDEFSMVDVRAWKRLLKDLES